jgi:hypothetical protein
MIAVPAIIVKNTAFIIHLDIFEDATKAAYYFVPGTDFIIGALSVQKACAQYSAACLL